MNVVRNVGTNYTYQEKDIIGKGSFGRVYKGYKKELS
jgi:hypothetical protein